MNSTKLNCFCKTLYEHNALARRLIFVIINYLSTRITESKPLDDLRDSITTNAILCMHTTIKYGPLGCDTTSAYRWIGLTNFGVHVTFIFCAIVIVIAK
jgi:hypothetical protein